MFIKYIKRMFKWVIKHIDEVGDAAASVAKEKLGIK